MSMNATFIQVEPAELAKIEANPSMAEMLFNEGPAIPPAFLEMSKKVQERMRAAGPQMMAAALQNPRIRQHLEERLGRTTQAFAAGAGGEDLLKMMEERRSRAIEATKMSQAKRPTFHWIKSGTAYTTCSVERSSRTIPSSARQFSAARFWERTMKDSPAMDQRDSSLRSR
jgi:hypothetical protein